LNKIKPETIIFLVNSHKSKINKSKGKKEIEEKNPSENKDEVVSTGNVACINDFL